MKRALITGISGQDGSFLAKYLLDLGYHVLGSKKNDSIPENLKILGISNDVELISIPTDSESIFSIIKESKPDEIYNLAAQSSVRKSFEQPLETSRVNAFGVAYLLEGIRLYYPEAKFFQASSSEIFGSGPCNEDNLKLNPQNPYSVSKAYSHLLTQNYRSLYNLFTVCGILFNHDSELRGNSFFTKQVARHVASYSRGIKSVLQVGNIYAKRDIGYAPEYVKAMHLSLQHKIPQDYIISTGKSEVIKNFINYCFEIISIPLVWKGSGKDEKGFHGTTGELLVAVLPEKFRPSDIEIQESNPNFIKKELGWKSEKSLKEIAEIMINYELKNLNT